MGKIVFWIVIIFAVLFALRLWNTAKIRAQRKDAPRAADADMVRCASCGVFLPRAEALPAPDGFRCREAKCQHGSGS